MALGESLRGTDGSCIFKIKVSEQILQAPFLKSPMQPVEM